jgi:phosphoglycolate phosphatase
VRTPPIRGLLFDKDGTLLDYFPTWLPINRAAAAAAAPNDPEMARRLLRAGGHDPDTDTVVAGSALVAGTAQDVAEAWHPLVGGDVGELTRLLDAVFVAEARRCAVPVPDLRRVLDEQRATGRVLGVATSDNEEAARLTLDQLGLTDLFPFVTGWDSGNGGKPGPGMVHAFCAAMGLEPAQVAVIGDSRHDLEMGRAAGVGLRIGVLTGPATRDQLAHLADVVIDDLRDLAAVLDG